MYVCVCKKVTETDLKNSLNKSDGNLNACQKSLAIGVVSDKTDFGFLSFKAS